MDNMGNSDDTISTMAYVYNNFQGIDIDLKVDSANDIDP